MSDFTNTLPHGDLIERLAVLAQNSTVIDSSFYEQHDVKRGLPDGNSVPCEGELYYRGIPIEDIVRGFIDEKRFGFEEVTYLLLFGKLPTPGELKTFSELMSSMRSLPISFVRDIIMKRPSVDMMNVLARCVLTLYAYDDNPDDVSIPNVLRQCLQLTAQMPLLSVYGYQVFKHYHDEESLIIHRPDRTLGTAENILHLLRPDGAYTALEAKILDLCLVLHAEHGGGNNSSFTTHVVTSSGTDTYSTVAASLGSLKGPRHGGANIKVVRMIDDMKNNLDSYSDTEIRNYLMRLLNREAFDRKGLIYGMGHAVYSISDPRAKILKSFVGLLAKEKGLEEDYTLYSKIERLAPEVIADKRRIYKGVSANIDFYSGFVYNMLGLPPELFTPIFAVSRMSGWSAHRIEELSNNGKIIRPAYNAVAERIPYVRLADRH